MRVYIYADVLLLVCFVTQLPVLWNIARSYGYRFHLFRCIIVAFIECITALVMIILQCTIYQMAIVWCVLTPVGVLISFGKQKSKQILILSVLRLCFDGAISGCSMLINLFVSGENKNHVSFAAIIVVTIIFCSVIRTKKSAYAVSVMSTKCQKMFLSLEIGNNTFCDWATVDSGNTLCEPISKCPVILLGSKNKFIVDKVDQKITTRYVPCRTAMGECIIECIKANAKLGKTEHDTENIGDVWVGYSDYVDCAALVGIGAIQLLGKEK